MRLTILLLIISSGFLAKGQSHTENLKKEFSFTNKNPNNTLMVANMNGFVHVTGYKGDKILIEAEKIIHAKTSEMLEEGKNTISIGYKDLADTVIVYIEGLCFTFDKHKNRYNKRNNGWDYDWCNCNRGGDGWTKDQPYDYTINFTVKVPEDANVVVTTVNNGDITVLGVRGSVVAGNVNGSIKLDHLQGSAVAHTVNGDVDFNYDTNPSGDCSFYTLNGDINANFSSGLAGDLSFRSFNGDFFTNINDMQLLPVTVEKADSKEGIRYKLKGNRYKVGKGGVNLDFETFNGNLYLKEKTGTN